MPKPLLDPKVKKLWTKALKSGYYKQGQRTLHNPVENTFCCLGVLCDLHRKHIKKGKSAWKPSLGNNSSISFYKGTHTSLPSAVAKWAFGEKHANESCPFIAKEGGGTTSLIRLNDSDKLPFTKIADLIEKNL